MPGGRARRAPGGGGGTAGRCGVSGALTYRFPRAVHLVRIGPVNGYVKTAKLRAANGRLRGVLITTDSRTLSAASPTLAPASGSSGISA